MNKHTYEMTVQAAKSGDMAAHIAHLRAKASNIERKAAELRRTADAQERLMKRILRKEVSP